MGCCRSKREVTYTFPTFSPLDTPPARMYKARGETLRQIGNMDRVVFDHRLPLNKGQIYILITSWRAIEREVLPTAVQLVTVKALQEQRVKQIIVKKNYTALKELEVFALRLMAEIDAIIVNLDEYDYITKRLRNLGARHFVYMGNQPELLWAFKPAFLQAVSTTLGDRYTERMCLIYETIIDFIIIAMIHGSNKESQAPGAPDMSKTWEVKRWQNEQLRRANSEAV